MLILVHITGILTIINLNSIQIIIIKDKFPRLSAIPVLVHLGEESIADIFGFWIWDSSLYVVTQCL